MVKFGWKWVALAAVLGLGTAIAAPSAVAQETTVQEELELESRPERVDALQDLRGRDDGSDSNPFSGPSSMMDLIHRSVLSNPTSQQEFRQRQRRFMDSEAQQFRQRQQELLQQQESPQPETLP